MLTFDQFVYLSGMLGTGLGAVWLFFQKVWWPAREKQQAHERQMQAAREAEAAKQREHERQMAEAKAAAEQSEDVARWQQMINLQSSLIDQAKLLLDFVITLATERGDKTLEQLTKVQTELRELRTSISLLTDEAQRQEDYREKVGAIPDHLLTFQEQLTALYQDVLAIVRKDAVNEISNS